MEEIRLGQHMWRTTRIHGSQFILFKLDFAVAVSTVFQFCCFQFNKTLTLKTVKLDEFDAFERLIYTLMEVSLNKVIAVWYYSE